MQLFSGVLHTQCFAADAPAFNDDNATENALGEYHACTTSKGDADCPGPPGAFVCRYG